MQQSRDHHRVLYPLPLAPPPPHPELAVPNPTPIAQPSGASAGNAHKSVNAGVATSTRAQVRIANRGEFVAKASASVTSGVPAAASPLPIRSLACHETRNTISPGVRTRAGRIETGQRSDSVSCSDQKSASVAVPILSSGDPARYDVVEYDDVDGARGGEVEGSLLLGIFRVKVQASVTAAPCTFSNPYSPNAAFE